MSKRKLHCLNHEGKIRLGNKQLTFNLARPAAEPGWMYEIVIRPSPGGPEGPPVTPRPRTSSGP